MPERGEPQILSDRRATDTNDKAELTIVAIVSYIQGSA